MKKILSICISTYNRAGFISETIESILPQLSSEVELLVVNNNSTDCTDKIIVEKFSHCANFKYVTFDTQYGFDRNYNRVVETSDAEFCWLFSDDDLIKPGAVDYALKILKTNKYDFVVVNGEERNKDLSRVLVKRRIGFLNDVIYPAENFSNMFVELNIQLNFIGANIIRRSIWVEREKEKYFGTEFSYVGVIFQKKLEKSTYFVSEPYVIIRMGNGRITKRLFDVWVINWPNMVYSLDAVSVDDKRKITPPCVWKNLKVLLINRFSGGYSFVHFKEYILNSDMTYVRKVSAFLILLIPIQPTQFCFNLFINFYKKIKYG